MTAPRSSWSEPLRQIGPIAATALALLAISACVASDPVVETPEGPVLIVVDEDLARFSSVVVDGVEMEPFPSFGGLLALAPDGLPLTLDDRSRAEIALERHCGAPVRDLSFRGYGEDGLSTWSSAPCDETVMTEGGE